MSLPLNGRALLVNMADYTYNSDKWGCTNDDSLYNGVIGEPVYTNEGAEPFTVADAKEHGKIEQDADDALIARKLKSARRRCEAYTGLSFITKTVTVSINNAYGGYALPYGPVTSTPTATDADGNAVALTYNYGQLDSPLGRMTITYNVGYTALPEELGEALLEQFLFMYENRGESSTSVSPMAKDILEGARRVL